MTCDINIIQNANNNNKLTIFIGSGISKSSNLPSWDDLISKIKKDLSLDEKENDYLKIAQLFYLSCGEVVYYQEIKKYFPDNIEPTIIQKMIFDLKPSHIITTNWDNLLEKTAHNNGFIYDVIAKDTDLVQSILQNHIIKMHGDFNNNNIVFKEDDYINYKENFPLIENYIKSILSTNTILFLGYSYNDINLKQITKWVQNNSESMPPMFLTVSKENKNQSRYLENFGIKSIVLSDEKKFNLDNYSNKIATFLEKLNSPVENNISIKSMSNSDVLDFVYKRLEPFDAQNSILLKQIQTALTNCGFLFDDKNKIILEFYEEILSYDINKNLREIYKKFREIKIVDLTIQDKEKLFKIYSILSKANIDGIIITSDNLHISNKKYFPISNSISNNESLQRLCNFNFNNIKINEHDIKQLMMKAYLYYQKYEYVKAHDTIQKIISLCFKQKNYIQLFFAMFNYNTLLLNIKFDYTIPDEISEKYKKLKSYNLDESFYELPKAIQKVLKDVKPFLSYDYLYKFIFEIDEELKKKQIQKKNIEEKNGFTLDSNTTRNYSKQKNLILFVLNNYIMIEKSQEFCSIQQKLIQITLIRQIQNDYLTLDKMELYSAIKYIDNKDLRDIFNNFNKEFKLQDKDTNWLISKILKNLILLYTENMKVLFHPFDSELRNTILILSKLELKINQSKKILKSFYILIEKGIPNFDLYELINSFIYNQKNMENMELIKIVELMIYKFVINQYDIFNNETLFENKFYAPFEHILKGGNKFDNIDLIKNFLENLEKYQIREQIKISQGFLYNLYLISDEKIKKLLKDFILSIDLKKLHISNLSNIDINNIQNFNFSDMKNYDLGISFKLFLAIQEFIDINKEFIKEIEEYPEKAKNNYFLIEYITSQIRYLVEKKNIKELESLLQMLSNKINSINEKNKQRRMQSIL
ncbi:SIR2 family protein [Aliarcobacter butzleri]|uniref:SIR2 family protein n=1 Tax=Aliarcobacter butzleri TaxID=28197 RepID=UPI000F47D6DA|nr:SIR2 family protein [Aliarcobacter butzleri]